ncbi:MAG: hypothetical protein WAM60_04835 [Candidatus Promineifilaceae bacterium]
MARSRIGGLIGIGAVTVIVIATAIILSSKGPLSGNTLVIGDEPQVAFLAFQPGRLAELYVYDHGTKENIKLTQTNGRVRLAVWSPDGGYIAFIHQPKGKDGVMYRLDVTNGELLQLTQEDSPACYDPAWSPNGSLIACTVSGSSPGDGEIILVQTDGSGHTSLTRGTSPFWSADSSRLIFIYDPEPDNPETNPDIASININDGLISTLATMEGFEDRPKWSPDESLIAYVENHYGSIPGGVEYQTLKIWDGENALTVAEQLTNGTKFEWSPDGTALRFLGCEYHVAAGETDCWNEGAVAYSLDNTQIAVVRDQTICIIPQSMNENCTQLPNGIIQLVGWR